MTKDEALKMARTALGVQLDAMLGKAGHLRNDDRRRYAENGIKAIDEALAQPEQEPVAWIYKGGKSFDGNKYSDEYELTASKQVALWKDKNAKPLYTTPPQRKPLTDEEINKLVDDEDWYNDPHEFSRIVEAKVREKNDAS